MMLSCIGSWLLHETTSFVRPPALCSCTLQSPGEGVIGEGVDAAPSVEAQDSSARASSRRRARRIADQRRRLFISGPATAGLAAFLANFESNPNGASAGLEAASPAVFADRTYYVVRWRSRRDTVYEGLNSVAERAEAGTDVSVRCTSLLEANAQTRRLAKADAGVVAKIYKVTGASVVELEPGGGTTPDAEDEWVGDFTSVKNAPPRVPAGAAQHRRRPASDLGRPAARRSGARGGRGDVRTSTSSGRSTESLKVTKRSTRYHRRRRRPGTAPSSKGPHRVMFGGKARGGADCEWCGGKGTRGTGSVISGALFQCLRKTIGGRLLGDEV